MSNTYGGAMKVESYDLEMEYYIRPVSNKKSLSQPDSDKNVSTWVLC